MRQKQKWYRRLQKRFILWWNKQRILPVALGVYLALMLFAYL